MPLFRTVFLGLSAALLLGACGKSGSPEPAAPKAQPSPASAPAPLPADPHSQANISAFVTQHLLLDLTADFDAHTLSGTAELRFKRVDAAASELVLDTRKLDIQAVEAAQGEGAWAAAVYQLDAEDVLLGSALRITLPTGADRVRVRYASSPEASGLQWLNPAQTAGKQQPFLFSQSESIHARSWVPLQDTPSVRFTYEARIHTPKALRAVMSADNDARAPRDGDYRFTMPQPIPSYLLAIAVGDLDFAPVSARSGVYAEPSVLPAAAKEFADTERMIQSAEKLYGPYRWGRYDLLILPPSFPYGGMENPRITFATPTVIVGDKSLVSLVAHELAHSWSGNLVTNASWRDFWLNESFTEYLTYRIMEAVYGPERADMERKLDADELRRGLPEVPEAQRMLATKAPPKDPDDIPSIVAYNRGALMLSNIEKACGRERFDGFLRGWFDTHAFTSQNTETFVSFLNGHLLSQQPPCFAPEKARAWIYEAPLPADAVYPESTALAQVDEARRTWLAGERKAKNLGAENWNVLHWRYFLEGLPENITAKQLGELDRAYHFTQSRNHVLLRVWLKLTVEHGYHEADKAVREHLLSVGRMLLLRPVYQALVKTPEGRKRAEAIYAEAKPSYHPITQAMVERILAKPDQPKPD